MPIIIDPQTGQRRFITDTSGGFSLRSGISPVPATTEANEFAKGLRSGIEQVKGLGTSALAAGAGLVGADEFSAEQTAQANRNFEIANRIGPRVKDFNTATESLENFGDFVAGGLGAALPTFGVAAAGGVGGILAKNLLKSSVSNTVAGAAGAFVATEGLETGGIFNDVVNDPEARKNFTLSELAGISIVGALPAAALDTLPLVIAARKFGLGLRARKEITSKMAEFGKGVTSQALIEGSTEAAQTVIERATHKFANDNIEILGPEGVNEILGALTIGAAFGGLVGGGVTLPGIVGSRMAELDQVDTDNLAQAEATFAKLRKIDDEVLQDHLDTIHSNFDLSDPEIQADLESALKDFNLRKPKFARNVSDNSKVQAFEAQILGLRKIRDEKFLTPDGKYLINKPEAIAFQEFLDGKTREFLNLQQRVSDTRDNKVESNKFQRTAKEARNPALEREARAFKERRNGVSIKKEKIRIKPEVISTRTTRTDKVEVGTVDRGQARRRVNVREKELGLPKETVYTKTGGIVRVSTEAQDAHKEDQKLSEEEKKDLTLSGGEPFTTDVDNILGDEKANVAFTDNIDSKTGEIVLSEEVDPDTGERIPMTASFSAKKRIAVLEEENPNASFKEVPAFEVLQERARQLESTNELSGTKDEEVIRLAQDNDFRMRTLSRSKQVGAANLDTIKKVKRHLEGRIFIERTNLPPALRPVEQEQLTKGIIQNKQTPTETERRQRSFADISTKIDQLKIDDPSQESFQKQLKDIKALDKKLKTVNPLRNKQALALMESKGIELTGEAKKDIARIREAVADEFFQLQQIFDDTELSKLTKRHEALEADLDKRQTHTIIRQKSGLTEDAKRFFDERDQIQTSTTPINVYWGSKENKQFSNLADRPFVHEDRKYRSVEQAYQSLKSGKFDQITYDKYVREGQMIRGNLKPMKPHKRIRLIRRLMYESFNQNPKIMKELLATGGTRFSHTQANAFWQKEFPAALHAVRARLRKNEFSILRSNDSASRYLLFGRNEAGKIIAVRLHSMIQKNFQRIFGRYGLRYNKDTIGVAYASGLLDLLINEKIKLIPESVTDDVIIFTDASKHPFTIGEIEATSKKRSLAASKTGAETLLARLKTDEGKSNTPDKIAAVKARIMEITRNIEKAQFAELRAIRVTDDLAKVTGELEDLVGRQIFASELIQRAQDTLVKIFKGESQTEVLVTTQKFISRADLKNNPDTLFVFGDNLQRKGLGGQAKELRGEPNAVGIPTKKAPNNSADAFFTDADLNKVRSVINTEIRKLKSHIAKGGQVVLPKDGLGTGRAQLSTKAPKIFAYLNGQLELLSAKPSIESNELFSNLETKKVARPEFDQLPAHTGNTNTYAGVGSRSTPLKVQQVMVRVAEILGRTKRHLSTGDAGGADMAFTRGAKKSDSSVRNFKAKEATPLTKTIAKEVHQNPRALSGYILDLQARNTFQVFGEDLKTPVDFLLAWSPNGEVRADQRVYIDKNNPKNTGGTGQAIALASLKGIPVINLFNKGWLKELGTTAGLSEKELAYIQFGKELPAPSSFSPTKTVEAPSAPVVLSDEAKGSLGDEYLRHKVSASLLARHESSEADLLQNQLKYAQELEVARLKSIFNQALFNNPEDYVPIPLNAFTQMVTDAQNNAENSFKEVNTEIARLKTPKLKFKFIMETTKNEGKIGFSAAEEMHDRLIQEQQYIIEENAADKKTLVSMLSRYTNEITRLERASDKRMTVFENQSKQHETFFKEHEKTFEKIDPLIEEYASSSSLLLVLNEQVADKNTSRNNLISKVRKIEKLGKVDLFITEELKKISSTMVAEMEGAKDEIQSTMKTEFEEYASFVENNDDIVGFNNASQASAFVRLQNEIIELETALVEEDLHPQQQLDFKVKSIHRDTPIANALKAKRAELKSFYINMESEPRVKSYKEQTGKAQRNVLSKLRLALGEKMFASLRDSMTEEEITFIEVQITAAKFDLFVKDVKGAVNDTARAFLFRKLKKELVILGKEIKHELKPIAAAVRQITGRIKTSVETLSLEQAMEAFNMTRQQLLETNGMYHKGQIWVKENLSPAVMREVIAHEVGHGVFENELRNASAKIQNDIRNQFDTWRERVRGKSVHDVIQSKAGFNTAMKYITESRDRAVSSLPAVDQAYLLDFEEWFADQVAVWESKKPLTAIGKFFKKIADLIRKIMGRQSQDSVREFLDKISQRNHIASAISRGRRFVEFARANKQIPDNSLISHLIRSAPNSLADIESLSNMLPSMFTKADLALLGRAFTQGHVRSQLFRLYPDHALKIFDESVSRTVAAGLVQWAHGQLKVGPQVHSVYEKAMGKIANTLGGKTEFQKQTEALHLIKQGKAIWGHVTDLGLTQTRTDAKDFKDVESISELFAKIGNVFEKVFISANDQLYGTKNPALIRLAQMFHSRTGTRLVKQGYFQEKQRNIGRYLSSATKVLEPLSDEQKTQVIHGMRTGNLTMNASRGMRQIFNAMLAYAGKNGVDINLRENYVPVIWNKEVVAEKRSELETLAEQYGVKDSKAAVDRILGLEDREIEEWLIPYSPSLRAAKQRSLSNVIPDTVLAEAGFISNDLDYITVNYIESLVKRVEYVKRFGDNSEKIIEITQDAERLGATTADIELMHSYIQAMMGITGHETNAALASMLGLKAPPPEQKINPAIQQVLSTVLVIRNLALLSLAMFTSLADPLGISVRSGSLSDTAVALKTGMQEIFNSVTGKTSEIKELANSLGILDSHMTNVALQWEYGGTYMAPWARKVNDTFFKWTGLTGLTRLTRSMALGASHSFIARHVSNPTKHSLRYLEELNLTPEEVMLTTDGKSVRILTFHERTQAPQTERDRDDKVRAAMNQFVDEAILRPNAAQRPIWASDPHYMLVFHLKAFMYSFHDRILRRAVTEMGQHNSLAPMVGLMMFIPALLFIDGLRDLIKHGGTPAYKENWDMGDYTFNAMERSGVFGIYQQGFDFRQAQQFGGTGAEAFFGGVFFPFKLFTDPAELVPFQNLSTK